MSERSLIDEIEVGVVVQGLRSEILSCNQAALDLLGLTAEQLNGKTSFDPEWNVIRDDGSPFPGAEHPVPVVLATGLPVRGVIMGVFRPRTADRVWLQVDALPRKGADGRLERVVCTFSDHTAWYEQERRLRLDGLDKLQRAREFSALVDASFDAIIGRDHTGAVVFWNVAAERLFGYTAAEMVGRGIDPIIPPDLADDNLFILGIIQRGDTLGNHQTVRRHKSGARIEVVMTVAPVPGMKRSVIIFHDIRARRESERALQRSEADFRGLIERAPDGMLVHRQGVLLLVNGAFADLMGFPSRQGLVGRTLFEFLHPDDRKGLLERLREAENGGGVQPRWKARALRADGSCIHVEVAAQAIEYEGSPARLVVVRDMTLALQEQEARLKAEAVFRSAFDYSGIGMAMVGLDGRWLEVNEALCRIVGYPPADLLATTFQAITHPEDLQKDLDYVGRVVAGEIRSYEMEKRYFHRAGHEVWVLLTVSLLRDAAGAPVHFISQIQDIDTRKRAESKLRAALDEKEVLLKEIHHRVKNNLQVIGSLLALQARRLPEGVAQEALRDSRQRIEAIARFHEQLYSSGDLSRVDGVAYLRDLASSTAKGLAAGRVSLEVEGDALTLPVDVAIPCGLIVNELVTNSLKHAFPDGRTGRVLVTLRHRVALGPLLVVSDDGVGLPPDIDAREAGSLGLRLVQLLSKQMGGTARAVPRQAGAAFEVTLPRVD